MDDFWLDLLSYSKYLERGSGDIFLSLPPDAGEFFGCLSSAELLCFINYMGYSCKGWDYDYRRDGDVIIYELGNRSGYCRCELLGSGRTSLWVWGYGSVVDLTGVVVGNFVTLRDESVLRWVLPVDILWGIARDTLTFRAVMCNYRSRDSVAVLDLSCLDFGEYGWERWLYWVLFGRTGEGKPPRYNCYGLGFTRWLVLDYCYEKYRLCADGSYTFMGDRKALGINKEFLPDILGLIEDEGYAALLRDVVKDLI